VYRLRGIKLYIQIYLNILSVPEVKKVELDKIDTHSIKKLLIEIGSPIIPLTLIFEGLGFGGVTGIEWGILAGAITALATELGYKVEKVGRSIVLIKPRENTSLL
jgi:hypothetical protein